MQPRVSEDVRKKIIAALTWVSLIAVLALALFTLLENLGSEVAGAHVFKTGSKVTLRYKTAKKKFRGRVRSERKSCRRNRRIVLVRARRGISDRVVDRTRTNRRGRWRIERKKQPEGRFYVVVTKRVRRPTGYGATVHKHKCKRDRSRTIELPRR